MSVRHSKIIKEVKYMEENLIKEVKCMEENLIKCTVRTGNGFIIECELSHNTIEKLKIKNLVSVRKVKKLNVR